MLLLDIQMKVRVSLQKMSLMNMFVQRLLITLVVYVLRMMVRS
nr:MAG TPA: hypothetical protein [Caudoviricetes sp.]